MNEWMYGWRDGRVEPEDTRFPASTTTTRREVDCVRDVKMLLSQLEERRIFNR